FTPSTGISVSSALNTPYVRKFSRVSAPGLATKLSQKSLSFVLASITEPGTPFFGASPYQTISAHRAPADVPLKPTSSNRFFLSMYFPFLCSMLLRISVSTPTSKAACIPPPWQPRATFFGPTTFFLLDLTIVRPLLPPAWLTRNQSTSRRVLHFCPGAPRYPRAHLCHP